jgi:hypothetical protein
VRIGWTKRGKAMVGMCINARCVFWNECQYIGTVVIEGYHSPRIQFEHSAELSTPSKVVPCSEVSVKSYADKQPESLSFSRQIDYCSASS